MRQSGLVEMGDQIRLFCRPILSAVLFFGIGKLLARPCSVQKSLSCFGHF